MKNTLLVVIALVAVFLVYRMTQPQVSTTPVNNDSMNTDTLDLDMMVEDNELTQETPVIPADDSTSMEVTTGDPMIVDVEGGMFYFKPDMLKVKKGQTVTVMFNNVAGVHDFVIDELSVKSPVIQQNVTTEVTFVADTAGTFEFYCSVGDHRARGMVGTLVVEE